MLYIHHTACISPQNTFSLVDLDRVCDPVNNQLRVLEPVYQGIPPGLLRRMGKAVKMGVGAALALLQNRAMPAGIIVGTANGGMEDCIKFLNQIIEYDEGILAPGNFVQSTTNAIAAQLGLMTANKCYNITHVQRGLAFENALLDAAMVAAEQPHSDFLVGGVDEISAYNFNIDSLDGWYKKQSISGKGFYDPGSDGSLAGEGAAMFWVNGQSAPGASRLVGLDMIHTDDEEELGKRLEAFIDRHLAGLPPDLLLSGENGDQRLAKYYQEAESKLPGTRIARFKHLCGEYPSASAFALWVAIWAIQGNELPAHLIKKENGVKPVRNVLIYNNFKRRQHSLMLVSDNQ